MRQSLVWLISITIAGLLSSAPVFALEQYDTEAKAHQHCPTDTVVWLNLPSMIWHYKGQRYYENTKHGAYVCEKEAASAGARATKNGE